jgi:hypothetical protein
MIEEQEIPELSQTARLRALEETSREHAERLAAVEAGLAENTALTKEVKENTSAIVDFFQDAKGFFALLARIGKLSRPIGYIAFTIGAIAGAISAVVAVVGALKSGQSPAEAAAHAYNSMIQSVMEDQT